MAPKKVGIIAMLYTSRRMVNPVTFELFMSSVAVQYITGYCVASVIVTCLHYKDLITITNITNEDMSISYQIQKAPLQRSGELREERPVRGGLLVLLNLQ